MSLMIFKDAKADRVVIVRSFRDPKFRLDYSSGRFVQMNVREFREKGLTFLKAHFEEYARIRLPEEKIVKPFETGEEKKLLKNSVVIYIWKDDLGKLWLAPLRLNKNDPLVSRDLGRENHRCLSANFSEADFWKIFDEVFAIAE